MELELKHIVPYLPYGLKVLPTKDAVNEFHINTKFETHGFKVEEIQKYRIMLRDNSLMSDVNKYGILTLMMDKIQPILRPLSDLKKYKPSSLQGETFFEWSRYNNIDTLITDVLKGRVKQLIFAELTTHRFDVFGLIDEGLAIDINTLESE